MVRTATLRHPFVAAHNNCFRLRLAHWDFTRLDDRDHARGTAFTRFGFDRRIGFLDGRADCVIMYPAFDNKDIGVHAMRHG